MKQLNHRFECWYKRTHWMAPELTKRADDEYEHQVVQAMYTAYRAGFNRANKMRKEMYSEDTARLHQALEALHLIADVGDRAATEISRAVIAKVEGKT